MKTVWICDYARTPIGRFGGVLATLRTDDLAGGVPHEAYGRLRPERREASVCENRHAPRADRLAPFVFRRVVRRVLRPN